MPTCSPARTIVDLARSSGLRPTLVRADGALHAKTVRRAEIDQVISDCAGWRGLRSAARDLGHADERSESVAESLARAIIIELGLPKPDLQTVLRTPEGHFVGRVDLCFTEQRVNVEVDGMAKYTRPEDLRREKIREDALRSMGYEVVRLRWADLMGPAEEIRRRILAAFERAARRAA